MCSGKPGVEKLTAGWREQDPSKECLDVAEKVLISKEIENKPGGY